MERWEARMERQPRWKECDCELFSKFAKDAQAHQIGERRIEKYRTDLTICNEMTGMGMCEMVKDLKSLTAACTRVNANKEYSFESKHDAKRTVGSLYCFVHYKNRSLKAASLDVRLLVQHLAKGGDKRLARPIITREEIRELSRRANNTMDKAMIWLLFESGMRNGEFEQLKKSDITQIEEGLLVKVPAGKTGEREVVVVEATKFVNEWLATHPVKDKDAPLWQSSQAKKPLKQGAISLRIRKVADRLNEYRKKQGIPPFTKSVNPHNFRHSRASELGGESGMTEQILDKYFGWEIGSNMPRTYLHLTADQVRKAILRTYGKARKEDEKKVETSWLCPRCKEDMPLALNYCGRCGGSKEGKVISLTEKMRQELAEMKKRQADQNKEMDNLARKLAALTVDKTKKGLKDSP